MDNRVDFNTPKALPNTKGTGDAASLGGHEVQNPKSKESLVKANPSSVFGKVKSLFQRSAQQAPVAVESNPTKSDREMLCDAIRLTVNTLQGNFRKGADEALKSETLPGDRQSIAKAIGEFFTKYKDLDSLLEGDDEAQDAKVVQNLKNDFPREAFQKMAVELQEKISVDPKPTQALQELAKSLLELTDSENILNKTDIHFATNLQISILPTAANIAFQWAAEALASPEKASRLDQLSDFCRSMMGKLLGKMIDALSLKKSESNDAIAGYSTAMLYFSLLEKKLQSLKALILSGTNKTKTQETLESLNALKKIAGEMSGDFYKEFFNGEAVSARGLTPQDLQKIVDDFNSGKGRYPSGIKKFFQNFYAQLKAI